MTARRMAARPYIHGTGAAEQDRLTLLNRLTNAPFLDFVGPPAGSRVLDLGCGLGLLAAATAARTGRPVIGVDISPAQLAKAAGRPAVHLVQTDAHHLPFADAVFDLAYARFVLEHVQDPASVLAGIRRVLRPGGALAVMENDISLLRFDPPCPRFDLVWSAFTVLQRQLGGDGWIGRRLHGLLLEAGFTEVVLSYQPELHWYGSPGFDAWIANIIGNVQSGRDALVAGGLCAAADIDAAAAELQALTTDPRASAGFAWNRARAVRPV